MCEQKKPLNIQWVARPGEDGPRHTFLAYTGDHIGASISWCAERLAWVGTLLADGNECVKFVGYWSGIESAMNEMAKLLESERNMRIPKFGIGDLVEHKTVLGRFVVGGVKVERGECWFYLDSNYRTWYAEHSLRMVKNCKSGGDDADQ